MERYQGTTSNILLAAQNLIKKNCTRFEGLGHDWIGIGFMGSTPMTPAFSITPERWVLMKNHTGGRYIIGRTITFQILEAAPKSSQAAAKLGRHVEMLNKIFGQEEGFNLKWHGIEQAFNFQPEQVVYPETAVKVTGFNVRQANVSFVVYSYGFRPKNAFKNKHHRDSSDGQIYEAVFNSLIQNRDGELSEVRGFDKTDIAPRLGGLSISLKLAGKAVNDNLSSQDEHQLQLVSTVWSKMAQGSENLLKNVSVADKLVDIFDHDRTFNGTAFNSSVVSIDYDTAKNEQKNTFYNSRVNLNISKRVPAVQFI